MESKVNIIKNDNFITIKKLSMAHTMSKELSYNTIGEFCFYDKMGYIWQYFLEVPKEYKTYTGWKKAIKRIFDIDVE